MTRVVELRVENYRSIGDEVVWSDLSAFEVLHGENNAGKSNLFSALRLAARLLLDDRWLEFGGDAALTSVGLDELRPQLVHRGREGATVRLGLRLAEPDVEATFHLAVDEKDFVQVRSSGWRLNGQPWVPPRDPPPEDEAPRWTRHSSRTGEGRMAKLLGLPRELVQSVNARRDAPVHGGSWGEWFLQRVKADTSPRSKAWWQRLSQAVATFEPLLGPGALDDRTMQTVDGAIPTLVWTTPEGHAIPFTEQGTGMQSVVELLAAISGTDAPIVLLEEPEVHASEPTQRKLRAALERMAQEAGRQLLVSSHVFGFDGPMSSRIQRAGSQTTITRRAPVAAASSDVDGQAAALAAAYAEAGQPIPSFVTTDGLVRLPSSIAENLVLPDLLIFAELPDGSLLAVPERVLQGWRQHRDPA